MSKKYAIYTLNTCNNCLKINLTLKEKFEKKTFMTYFGIFFNIHLIIIISINKI